MNAPALVDSFGRRHNNLRISVTDRCNLRCTYCMPEEAVFLPKDHLLTFEEIARFVQVAASLGVDKIRLTGGEPLLRQDLPTLVRLLHAIDGIADIGLTTNGLLLDRLAGPLYGAGLRRLNISLDSLDGEQFKVITRRDALDKVLAGIAAAKAAGFKPIKLNAVALKGVGAEQVLRLARYCRDEGFELRFIEFMPLEADGIWDRSKVLTADEILAILADAGMPAVPVPGDDPHAPAEEYEYSDGGGKLGIIASVSKPFCGTCNRLRLTAEGKLRNCLFSLDELDARAIMRSGGDDAAIADLLQRSVAAKWAGHQINLPTFTRPERTMHAIGG